MSKRCRKTQEEEEEADSNQKKKLKRCQKTQDEDRISELPDTLVHLILTQLGTTKESLHTRLLSKKWKSLWNSIPVLDFGRVSSPPPLPPPSSQDVVRDRLLMLLITTRHAARVRLLMNFIKTILLNRENNSPINKFCLYLDQHFDSSLLLSWISYLIMHSIQHLHLVFHQSHHQFAFPCSFFTCHSLTVFKLEMSCLFNLPTNASSLVSFPSLKVLSLKYVSLSDDVEQLFSACPLLEELYFYQCKWVNINTVKISALALHTLHLLKHNGDILIFAPHITSFSFSGNLPAKHFVLGNLPSLAQAHINPRIDYRDFKDVGVRQLALKFLQPFLHVSVLTIHGAIGRVLFKDGSLLPKLPTLENLITLTLQWDSNWFTNHTLLNILHAVPNLENLHINGVLCQSDFLGHLEEVNPLPQCLLFNLKHIDVFIGDDYWEKYIISFFMRNARVLEEMVVTFHPAMYAFMRETLTGELATVPICSQKCSRLVFR